MKKRWIALAAGAAVVAVGAAVFRGPRPPALAPPVTIHSGNKVEKLALSPDGRLLADDAPSGQVLLYDTVTGRQSCALPAHMNHQGWIRFSPDGRRLLTMGASPTNPNGNMRVWDTATGAQLSRFVAPAGPGAWTHLAALSRDWHWAIAGGVAGDQVYDFSTGTLVKALPLTSGMEQAVFSADRSLLAVRIGTAETLQVWDTKTWRRIQTIKGPFSGVSGIRFSPDGTRLALGSQAGLAWCDTRTWKPAGHFTLPSPLGLSPNSFCFTPDGRSLMVNQDRPTEILHQVDRETGRETLTEPGQTLQHMSRTGDRAEALIVRPKRQYFFLRDTYCI